MFNSIHYQRLLKWTNCTKKFIVNLEIKIGSNYTFKDVEVVAKSKSQAFKKAKQQVMDDLKIIVKGSKSLGKVRQFDEF